MKVTIYDVAARANVSASTVSRVINNKSTVHAETRKLVLQAIEDLGFVPDRFAQQMINKKSKLIGVIIPHIGPSFYGKIVEGIENKAREHGYRVFFCNTYDNIELEAQYLKFFKQYWVDGIIIASNFNSVNKLMQTNIPFVAVDHLLDDVIPTYPVVTSDNVDGGRLGITQLINAGCKKIALLRGPSFLMTTIQRTKGVNLAIENKNVEIITKDFDLIDPNLDELYDFFKQNLDIDGVFCFSDTLAIGALNVLNKLNKKIPDDISIIGFDNIIYTKWTTPALTTIEQDSHLMGEKAFSALYNLMTKNEVLNYLIPIRLIERNSIKTS